MFEAMVFSTLYVKMIDHCFFFLSLILRWTQINLRITRVWRSHWQVPMVIFVVLIIKKFLKYSKEKVRANAPEDLTRQIGKFM